MPNEDLINTPKVIGDELESTEKETSDVLLIKNPNNKNTREFQRMNIKEFMSKGVIIKNNRNPQSDDITYSKTNENYNVGSLWINNNKVWILISNDGTTANWVELSYDPDKVETKFERRTDTYNAKNPKHPGKKKYYKYDIKYSADMIVNGIRRKVYASTTDDGKNDAYIKCSACNNSGCLGACTSCSGGCEGCSGRCDSSVW